ncbi:MAG: mandelate racemase/muconate lactonizing enzyme family protein [Planctomycetota bacterium]|jgi:L-alanine-DL-glutamate epimerase-like enolase superfamily enzyme|nr:mandelate racemase/muconate lactonizing enzyme family protein [Planctomycetota bacterium]MDP6502593.1 mandelate racemase/muconate lactonizing enzyme family protein [Planctomycetota bacterium]
MIITEVIAQVLRLPQIEAKTAGTQDTLLIRVRTDTGLEGIGEVDSSPEPAKAVIDAPFSHNIASGLREILVGEDPLQTERLWDKMYKGTFYFGRRMLGITAMAGIDLALWDLKGKHFGVPVHTLLGGKRHDRIRAYASILFGKDGQETADIGRRWTEVGYTAVKFGWEPMGDSEKLDLELVAGGREGVGPDGDVLIDAGCVWDARTALQRAHSFADYKIGWLEEPLQQDDIDGYVWLRDRSPVPIAAGEGECGRQAFAPWVQRRALDIYQIDLARCGFTDAMHTRRCVEDAGGRVVNHCYKTPISVAACLHWLSTANSAFLFEDCVDDSPLRHDLTHERVQAEKDGYITVPDGPGLGVTLNEEFVEEFKVDESG